MPTTIILRAATALVYGAAAIAAGCGSAGGSATASPPAASSGASRAIATIGSGREATRAAAPRPGWPSAMAIIGHSGSTGEDSDPAQPHVEIRANSWATGTNPAVNSVYQRILAHNPAIRGHNFNLAQGGANIRRIARQARRAVTLNPRPDLVLIQAIDSDIVCPATTSDFASFRRSMQSVIRGLSRGLPRAKVFVTSQFGSVPTYARALSPAQRKQFGGTGPCAFLDPGGRLVPREVDRLERIIHGYEAAARSACRAVPRCFDDRGAFGRTIDRPEYITEDLNHFSVKGHAKAAAVAFAAMRRAGALPR
jgi:hypothetical protein